jgi:acyl transferase domain-containing protein
MRNEISRLYGDAAVAVVGMSGRFPGAPDLDAFWQLLVEGRDSIERLSEDDLRLARVPPELARQKSYVPACAAISRADCFDAHFFGFTPA